MGVKCPKGGHNNFLGENNINKTKYDWFPGESQNSRKLKKGREICNYFWKIEVKNLQKGHNLAKNGQILSILEFSQHMEYDFLKERNVTWQVLHGAPFRNGEPICILLNAGQSNEISGKPDHSTVTNTCAPRKE